MNIQYLIENPKYVTHICEKIDGIYIRIGKYAEEFDKNYITDILELLIDLNSKMSLNLNFSSKVTITHKKDSEKYFAIGEILGYLTRIKEIIQNLVKYQSSPDKYSYRIESEMKFLPGYLLKSYELCYRIFYLHDV